LENFGDGDLDFNAACWVSFGVCDRDAGTHVTRTGRMRNRNGRLYLMALLLSEMLHPIVTIELSLKCEIDDEKTF
jgi:hypothetical protein